MFPLFLLKKKMILDQQKKCFTSCLLYNILKKAFVGIKMVREAKKIKCRTCGKEFDPKTKRKMRGGFIDQCVKCSKEDRSEMYLGRPGATNKGANIEIYRKDLKFVKSVLNAEKARGPTANLIISNPANQLVRDGKKEEEGE